MRMFDGLVNLVSGIGTRKDKVTQYRASYKQLSQGEVETLYLGEGLARKCIDTIPGDMVREWRSWEAKEADAINDAEKALKIREHVYSALVWADLYGGAAILIGDGNPNPTEPFEPEAVARGGIKYLHTFHRWELFREQIERDVSSPDFGKPRTYRIQASGSDNSVEVHRSRFAFFYGADAPRLYRDENEGWGLSKFDAFRQALLNVGAAAANSAALVEEAKTDIVTIPELNTYLQTPEGEQQVIRRFGAAMQLKSTINTLLLGTGETFDRKQISFSGLPDLIRMHLDILAGVVDIPVTRLLGVSPRGLSGKGDHETRNYYDHVRSRQTNALSTALEGLDKALIRHATGKTPRNVTYSWVPLWQPSPEEKAATEKTRADTDAVYASLGIFPKDGFANTVRDRLIAEKSYPTIDTNIPPEALTKLGSEPLQVGKAVASKKDANALESGAGAGGGE